MRSVTLIAFSRAYHTNSVIKNDHCNLKKRRLAQSPLTPLLLHPLLPRPLLFLLFLSIFLLFQPEKIGGAGIEVGFPLIFGRFWTKGSRSISVLKTSTFLPSTINFGLS